MDRLKNRLKKWLPSLERWKYPALILAIGLVLLMLPRGEGHSEMPNPEPTAADPLVLEERALEEVLSQVHGAGSVRVLLSLYRGEDTVYEKDTQLQSDTEAASDSVRQSDQTVLRSAGSGTQQPLVRSVTAPVYRGAVIVCQGGDDPQVQYDLIRAVAGLTGLGTDKIIVMKMSK